MCKIILKFEEPLTHGEMEGHREHCEKGAGIMGWSEKDKSLISFKSMSHNDMWHKYCEDKRSSPFWLFHSRMPSAGDVSIRNVQPFHGKETIGFCHNGTVSKDKLFMPLAAMGEYLDGTESDSYMLFRFLRACHPRTAQTVLDDYRDNFVYVHVPSRTVYVIGRFDVEIKGKRLMMAKNSWGEQKSVILCEFDGKIKNMKKEKPWTPTRYFTVGEDKGTTSTRKFSENIPCVSSEGGVDDVEDIFGTKPSPQLEADYEHLEGLSLDLEEGRNKTEQRKS